MNIGAIIICRYNSTRLPGKILKKINKKSILQHIIERLKKTEGLKIVVATSIEATDDPIADFCTEQQLDYYRGSLKNVSERFLKTALHFNLDYAIRINGDNLFIDIESLSAMITIAQSNTYDFISNVKNRTFPYGMSLEIIKTTFYKKLFPKLNTDYYQEHVTIYLYEHEESGAFKFYFNEIYPRAAGLKIAIDTKSDFEKAQKIVSNLKHGLDDYNLKDIATLIRKYKDE